MTRAIIPNSMISLAAQRSAVKAAMDNAAKQAKAEFEKTTATWSRRPEFTIEAPSEFSRTIATDSEIYGYVNDGTRPHIIPVSGTAVIFPGGLPKTAPRIIGSGTGSPGKRTFTTKPIHHPGTEAREFDDVIAEQMEPKLATEIQRAVDGGVE